MKKQRFRKKTAQVCRTPEAEPGSGFMKGLLTASCTAILLALSNPPVLHADVTGVFEADDGNAIDENPPEPEDDWDVVLGFAAGTSEALATSYQDGGRNGKLFTQGSKDDMAILDWVGKEGSITPGNDFLNAYAAAYNNAAGDLILTCGVDRYQENGSFAIGCWFFQDEVAEGRPIAGGGGVWGFYGEHLEGDILVTAEFGGQGVDVVNIFEWVGDDATGGLVPVVMPGVTDYQCSSVGLANTSACGETNLSPITIPWEDASAYKFPQPGNQVPPGTFVEVIINVSELFPEGAGCFSSFMATSRTSPSLSASTKEYALGEFNLCKISMDKTCAGGSYNPVTKLIEIDYTLYAKNTGAAGVGTVEVTDNQCTADTSDDVVVDMLAEGNGGLPLQANELISVNRTCSLTLDELVIPATNVIYGAQAYTGTTGDLGATVPVFFEDIGNGPACQENAEAGSCTAACNIQSNPSAAMAKNCVTRLAVENDTVVVKVPFNGYFANSSGNTPLENIAVCDTTVNGGPCIDSGFLVLKYEADDSLYTGGVLEPGERLLFEDTYTPSVTNSECPSEASFMNTVTATADDAITGLPLTGPTMQASDTCGLCPEGGCENLPQ